MADAAPALPDHDAVSADMVVDPALSYRDAAVELDALVRSLEGGQLDVDGVVAAVGRASALVEFCRAKVHDAEMKVRDITARPAA